MTNDAFLRDGLVVIPGFLDAATCAALTAACRTHFGDAASAPERHGCTVRCWDPLRDGHPAFRALAEDPRLADITQAIVGPGYSTAPGMLVMHSAPGGTGQSWHQDCPAPGVADVPEHHHNVNRLIYCTDVGLDDGAVVTVPGSHRRGILPPGDHHEDLPGQQVLCPRAGTLVLLHGWCWHRVTANRTGRGRLSINHRVYPAGCPIGVDHVGVYRDAVMDFTTGIATARATASA